MSRLVSILIALLAVPMAIACTSEQGYGWLEGEYLSVESCEQDQYDRKFYDHEWEFHLFTTSVTEDVGLIRLQTGGIDFVNADGLSLKVEDYSKLQQKIDRDGEVTVPFDGNKMRGSLFLFGTCPNSYQALVIKEGTITFTEAGSKPGEQVTATMDVSIHDGRSEVPVGKDFHGEFSFEILAGTPYQYFTAQ